MADIVTGTVTGQLDTSTIQAAFSDVRRETALEAGDIRREGAKEASDTRAANEANTDRIVAQDTAYFIAGQSQNFSNATSLAALTASTNANFNQTLAAIQLAGQQSAAATALEGARSAAASALGQALLGTAIATDGAATRALMNSLKMDELNRMLGERNAVIVESRGDARLFGLSNQINALHSQFQAASQGTVNFGTMSGSAGTNTSTNNVV